MEDFFSFGRFWLLLKNHLIENRKKYTLFAVSMFAIGLLLVFLFFIFNRHTGFNSYCVAHDGTKRYLSTENDWRDFQAIIYWFGLFMFGGMFALSSYVNFGNQGEAIFYMNKPASIFEKWLVEIFVHMILYFAVYSLVFFIIFVPSTLIYNLIERNNYDLYYSVAKYSEQTIQDFCNEGTKPAFEYSSVFVFNTFAKEKEALLIYVTLISSFVSGISFFMYGSVLFNKFSFFKTFLLGFAIFIVYILYAFTIQPDHNVFIAEGWSHSLFKTKAYKIGEPSVYVKMREEHLFVIYYCVAAFIPISLMLVSYFKLKEKEI
ncbi:MAG TPA: hypothetical protein VL947_14015 [Cytophagales bacterium]|nr:hypothetical protein [Cytophagales bacterium]